MRMDSKMDTKMDSKLDTKMDTFSDGPVLDEDAEKVMTVNDLSELRNRFFVNLSFELCHLNIYNSILGYKDGNGSRFYDQRRVFKIFYVNSNWNWFKICEYHSYISSRAILCF